MSTKKPQTKRYDEVISSILNELDTEQSEYQRLYKKFYGKRDDFVAQIHSMMSALCFRIREDLNKGENE